jgi:UDP-GlcNAc:undecaprenyl-phosphate GlcNAc-1-phosphate transferase
MAHFVQPQFWHLSCSYVFVLALIFSAVLGAAAIALGRSVGLVDEKAEEKERARQTLRLGGVPIWAALIITLGLTRLSTPAFVGILYAGAIVLVLGVWDDLHGVDAFIKIICLALATIIMAREGVHAALFGNAVLNYIATFLWVAGMAWSFKAMDHMDGLAGGSAFVGACMFVYVGATTGQYELALMSLALAGAVSGFLVLNQPPSPISLGTSGSFFIGFSLAALGVLGAWSSHPVKAALVPIIILSVPLCNMGCAAFCRCLAGDPRGVLELLKGAGRDQFSHRLLGMGFSRTGAVLFIVSLSLAMGIVGVVMRNSPPVEAILLTSAAGVLHLLIFGLMAKTAAELGGGA